MSSQHLKHKLSKINFLVQIVFHWNYMLYVRYRIDPGTAVMHKHFFAVYLHLHLLLAIFYCAFHKHANSEVQKANWWLRFSLVSIILTDLLGNKTYFKGFKRSKFVICDWWISIHFVCFCVSRFVACDRNYDWRQRKTQLWRRLLNFRVRMFVKSAVSPVVKKTVSFFLNVHSKHEAWRSSIKTRNLQYGPKKWG